MDETMKKSANGGVLVDLDSVVSKNIIFHLLLSFQNESFRTKFQFAFSTRSYSYKMERFFNEYEKNNNGWVFHDK